MFFSPSGEVAGVSRSAESFLVALCNVHVNGAQLATLIIRVYTVWLSLLTFKHIYLLPVLYDSLLVSLVSRTSLCELPFDVHSLGIKMVALCSSYFVCSREAVHKIENSYRRNVLSLQDAASCIIIKNLCGCAYSY